MVKRVRHAVPSALLLLGFAVSAAAAAAVPTLDELAGRWVELGAPPSAHVPAEQLDMPVIQNFYGSVGSAPASARPVDLFAVSALELPPYVGCGAPAQNETRGCGALSVDGRRVAAARTKWSAYEVLRQSDALGGGGNGDGDGDGDAASAGLVVTSALRLGFESHVVMWQLNLTNTNTAAEAANSTGSFTGLGLV